MRAHPLVHARQSHDADLLGLFSVHPDIQELDRVTGPSCLIVDILPIQRQHGLVRTDMSEQAQAFALGAIVHGSLWLQGANPPEAVSERIADVGATLAEIARSAFEPSEPVSDEAAAKAAKAALAKIDAARTLARAIFTQRTQQLYGVTGAVFRLRSAGLHKALASSP